MRSFLSLFILTLFLNSCSGNREAKVNEEAMRRSRMEAFRSYWNEGNIQADLRAGEAAYHRKCMQCHGAFPGSIEGQSASLQKRALSNADDFFYTINYGKGDMPEFYHEVQLQDLVAITAWLRKYQSASKPK